MRIADLQPGWVVQTNDGQRLGRIKEVGQQYVEVSGGLFSSDFYVPTSAIANVEHKTVHLSVAHRDVEAMGWHQPPRSSDELQTAPDRDVDRHI